MNGSDNISTNSKLKEVEQRLKIELNLREKNIAILEEMNKDNGSNSKSWYFYLKSKNLSFFVK